jgi:hypothetical protein
MVFLFVPATHASFYNFTGTFVDFTAPDTSMFDPLESQPFSGEFDLANQFFSFDTAGYSYSDSDVASWIPHSGQSLIFMNGGIYFDVRDVAGLPTTLWIKSGIDMIGGDVNASVVPIPGAVWLLGSGLIGLLGFRRKLRKG